MKIFSIGLTVASLTLAGCGTTNYQLYADAQVAVASANSKAEIERYRALSEIAKTGDSAARVAAVMSLNQNAPQPKAPSGLAAPTTIGDTMLKWASVLVPSITQVYGIGKSTEVAITHSNNSVKSQQSNNEMVVDLVQGRVTPIIGNRTTDPNGSQSEDFLLYPR
jgi:hypothetical protein